MITKICFLGGARYGQPLDTTSEKKFRALRSLGDIFIIGFAGQLRPRRFFQHGQFYLLPNFQTAVLRYLEIFIAGPVLLFWLIFRQGVQVVVTQSPYEGVAGALAKIAAGCIGRKVTLIVENHGDFEESVFLQRRVSFQKVYRFIMRRMAHFALKRANGLRSISSSTQRQLEAWMPGTAIVQFPTWTDIGVFLQASVAARNNSKFQDILYTGVLIPRKGVEYLIKAFAQIAKDFRQARLVIVGSNENKSYTTELKKQVEQLGLHEQVQFLPPMSQSELAKQMSEARVFVLPSTSEGLGRVVFEAMASGTPVIGSRVGGIPDMVDDGVTGFLVPPGNEQALAEKLRWMLEHPEEAKVMGERSRVTAERIFSTEAYIRGYRKLFSAAHSKFRDGSQHAHSAF
jgi:glycosyltransferase involved in cell wall biosynthesis